MSEPRHSGWPKCKKRPVDLRKLVADIERQEGMSSTWDKWVIDASMSTPDGLFCFCPVELDEAGEIVSVITGMNYLSDKPPRDESLIAVIHPDGQEAAEAFCEYHKDALARLKPPTTAAPQP